MRSNRNTRLGLAAIAVALILLGIYAILRSRQPATPPTDNVADSNGVTTETVSTANKEMAVFARVNIPERTLLTADMLELKPLNEGRQGNFVRDIENGALGYITRQAIKPGVAIEQKWLLGHISEVGIAGALQAGRRAMIVPITNKATLHDLVRIGDRVDILSAFDQQESRVIVQNVRVLAVDVFGGDYPQVKVAMRGDYKAPPRGISAANPASPKSAAQPGAGQPIDENAPPAPTPTPQPTPPPTRPEAALTIEVTPEQAVAISLAQASGTNLDFTLRPHDEVVLATGTGVPGAAGAIGVAGAAPAAPIAASITRPRLAPGAESIKRRGGATTTPPTRTASTGGGSGGGGGRGDRYSPVPMPETFPPPTGPSVPPATFGSGATTAAAPTYDIPIYGDGKLVRTDTVRKPQD